MFVYFSAKVVFLFEIWKKNSNFAANFNKEQHFENFYTHYSAVYVRHEHFSTDTQTRNPCRMADNNPESGLATISLRLSPKTGTHRHPQPTATCQYKYCTRTGTCQSQYHLSFYDGALGYLYDGYGGAKPGLRCPAVLHR